jgi:hypothetical protein
MVDFGCCRDCRVSVETVEPLTLRDASFTLEITDEESSG